MQLPLTFAFNYIPKDSKSHKNKAGILSLGYNCVLNEYTDKLLSVIKLQSFIKAIKRGKTYKKGMPRR